MAKMRHIRNSEGALLESLAAVLLIASLIASCMSFSAAKAYAAPSGSTPLLAIVVGFEGEDTGEAVPYSNVYNWNETLLSGEGSLFAYFQNQSNGAFELVPARETSAFGTAQNTNRADRADDGIVHVTLASGYHAWGLVNEDVSVTEDFERTVLSAFAKAQAFVDFDSYDTNGDGAISSHELFVVVCVPGYDASAFSQPGRTDLPLMWPHSGKITQKLISEAGLSGAVPTSYFAVTENFVREGDDLSSACQEPIGILAHELGHCLVLPDLYALNADDANAAWGAYEVGQLSLMANGVWTEALDDQRGWVFMPAALDPWCLTKLGWTTPQTVESGGEYHLYSRESEEGYNVLLIPTDDPEQYFLVENREPEGCDAGLVSTYGSGDSCGGIVIWHVDQGICERFDKGNAVNNTDHRPGVMPVFFEKDASGAYTFDWANSAPVLDEPFFSATSIEQNLGDASANIELPLYAKEGADEPARRVSSGISLQVLSVPGHDMIVRVKLAGETSQQAGVGGGAGHQGAADPQAGADGEAETKSLLPDAAPAIAICVIAILCAVATFAFRRSRMRRDS